MFANYKILFILMLTNAAVVDVSIVTMSLFRTETSLNIMQVMKYISYVSAKN